MKLDGCEGRALWVSAVRLASEREGSVIMLTIAVAAAAMFAGQAADDSFVVFADTAPVNVALRCTGTVTGQSSATVTNSDGSLGPTLHQQSNNQAEAFVRLGDGAPRIRVPSLDPPARSGSSDGWRTLSEVSITDDLITARYSHNPFNRPSVRIDRVTGTLEVRSLGKRFEGRCEPYDPAARRF